VATKKSKTAFFCTECGYEVSKWVGRCPGCGEWNTMAEQPVTETPIAAVPSSAPSSAPVPLPHITTADEPRVSTLMGELDRVLGGGVVAGSLTLIGGDPGIGKSTLLLQAANSFASEGHRVVYISGEESPRQVALRAKRIGAGSENLFVLSETDLKAALISAQALSPKFIIIDSIQTVFRGDVSSAPGSIAQVRECTSLLMQLAKTSGISVFLVGHVTKNGAIAGPRMLEHMVDTVLYFEGDNEHAYRVLRAVKNRFGSTNEVGMFEMKQEGMTEVTNPSEMLLASRGRGAPGSVVTASLEGMRPVMVEVQALVCSSAYTNPRRQATGVDYNRLAMLLAILEKRMGMRLFDQDAYVNAVGGLRLVEPAVDLSIALAIASSFRNTVPDNECAVFGEVGLTGEVRPVRHPEMRLQEAARAGFKRVILPKRSCPSSFSGLELIGVGTIAEALIEYL